MIKSITTGAHLITTGGSPMMPYISPGAQGAGQMRYNTSSNNMEVWDGVTWKELGMGYANIELTGEAVSLLEWARKKRNEELESEQLAKENPIIQDLLEQIKLKQDQLRMAAILVKEEQKVTT